jgi:asparagine synthase (glutamine-hydrolysing)
MCTLRFTQEAKTELFTDKARSEIHDSDSIEKILHFFQADNVDHVIDRMLHTDLMTRMPDHLLSLIDRMSMAHSLEVRSPFVDYRMVEFAANIPARLKLKGFTLKYMLRRIASRYLSKEVVYRKKQGFGFPIGMWLRNELKPLLLNLMKNSRFVELGLFRPGYVNTIVDEHLSGKMDHTYRLWMLLNLEVWHRAFFENQTQSQVAEQIQRLSQPQ